MGIFCTHCDYYVGGGLRAYQKHLSRRHDPPFHCCEDECERRKFAVKKSLFRHLREHHFELCETSSGSDTSESDLGLSVSIESLPISNRGDEEYNELGILDDGIHEHNVFGGLNERVENNSDGDHDSNIGNDVQSSNDSEAGSEVDYNNIHANLQRYAARFLLELRRRGNVTGTAISIVIEETQVLLNIVLDVSKEKIAENMRVAGVDVNIVEQCLNDVVACELFKSLKTKEQQINYFIANFNYVAPQSKPLGYRNDIKIDKRGVPIPVQIQLSFQYIPITETLKAVLNNEVLFRLIHSEQKSTDGKIRSFLDGSVAAQHPLVSEYPFTIRITLHTDDVDAVNPLGSKCGIHKITEVQFQIQNLPPEENARLRSVFVLAYAYKEDLPEKIGIDALLEPFFLELQDLETPDGVEIEVNGRPYTLRASLVAGAADAAAAHEILGLYSCSCSKFCSLCTVSKQDFHKDIFAEGQFRTKELHQFHMKELAEKSTKFVRENYGVMKRAILFENSAFAAFPEAMQKDAMHDLLKGVAPMEIKLVLHEFCFVKKYFDVFDFNARIRSFNVGPADEKNRPSPNFSIDSVRNKGCYTIHQTAAQTWCLLQIFAFLVLPLNVPIDNPHLRLLVLLKRISVILFSLAHSEANLQELDRLTHEHHQLFFQLYPPGEEEEEAGQETEEDVDDVDSEDFDNLPDDPEDWENYVLNNESLEANDENIHEPNSLEASDEEVNDSINLGTSGDEEQPLVTIRQRKKPKKIRPINKHHHLRHFAAQIRKFGPAVLYWCMR